MLEYFLACSQGFESRVATSGVSGPHSVRSVPLLCRIVRLDFDSVARQQCPSLCEQCNGRPLLEASPPSSPTVRTDLLERIASVLSFPLTRTLKHSNWTNFPAGRPRNEHTLLFGGFVILRIQRILDDKVSQLCGGASAGSTHVVHCNLCQGQRSMTTAIWQRWVNNFNFG